MRKTKFIPLISFILIILLLITHKYYLFTHEYNITKNEEISTNTNAEVIDEIVTTEKFKELDLKNSKTEINTADSTNIEPSDTEIITTCVLDVPIESTESKESTIIYNDDEEVLDNSEPNSAITDNDFYTICSVVEAETHGADSESKIHIVSVILNRVNSPAFPNTIQGVCCQSGQFAYRSDIEQSTIDAVTTGLNIGDTVQGALFFCTCRGCWADTNKEYVFTDNVGHSFYK